MLVRAAAYVDRRREGPASGSAAAGDWRIVNRSTTMDIFDRPVHSIEALRQLHSTYNSDGFSCSALDGVDVPPSTWASNLVQHRGQSNWANTASGLVSQWAFGKCIGPLSSVDCIALATFPWRSNSFSTAMGAHNGCSMRSPVCKAN